jgi:enoyl-CoA hydratase/carnithine racemase
MNGAGGEELVIDRDGGVLIVRINRPERRNALSVAVITGLAAAVNEAETSSAIRVLLLTGTGEQSFCAGMDLKEFAEGGVSIDPADMATFLRLTYGQLDVPVVAAVNGSAVGGGLELLYGADMIVAADTAMFGLPEVKRGLFPAGSGTLLGTRIPMVVALELALTGDLIAVDRAYEVGLVNQVVAPAELMVAAIEVANRIAANGPLGVRAAKELIRAACADPEQAQARSEQWRAVVFASDDAREGAAAFLAKRRPNWSGS